MPRVLYEISAGGFQAEEAGGRGPEPGWEGVAAGPPLRRPEGVRPSSTADSQPPSLQKDEMINFCGFKPPNLQSFVTAGPETNTIHVIGRGVHVALCTCH